MFTRILPEGSHEYAAEPQQKIEVFADAPEEVEGGGDAGTEGDGSSGNKTQQPPSQRLRYEI